MHKTEIRNRQEAEQEFHDRKFGGERVKNYYAAGFTDMIIMNMMSKMGNVEDKQILEFGCGEGWMTKILAGQGAKVWAFDISKEAVELTKERLHHLALKYPGHVEQMSAEDLRYDAEMFDIIIGVAILHHLDLKKCMQGIQRVLKKGGRAYFMEPLGHNPFLNLYRRLTPHLRSRDEMPLRFQDFDIIKPGFSWFEHEEFYLTAMFALAWHHLRSETLMMKSRDFLCNVDSLILSLVPYARRYCWYSVLSMEK